MNKVNVSIYGRDYTLLSDKPKDFIIKVATFVNDEIENVDKLLEGYGKIDVLILACNNIAEKYFDQLDMSLNDSNSSQNLLKDINMKKREIASLELQLEQKDIKIKALEMTDLSSKSLQAQIEKTKEEYEEKILEYKKVNEELESKFFDLQMQLAKKQEEIEILKSQNNK